MIHEHLYIAPELILVPWISFPCMLYVQNNDIGKADAKLKEYQPQLHAVTHTFVVTFVVIPLLIKCRCIVDNDARTPYLSN